MATTQTIPIANKLIYSGKRMTEQELSLLKMKLIGLRRLSKATGFSTNKIVVDLLSRVSPSDLILLGWMFDAEPSSPEAEGVNQ